MIKSSLSTPLKILLGVDGSSHAAAAADLLTHITWPAGTSTHVLAVATEPRPELSFSSSPQRVVVKQMVARHQGIQTTMQSRVAQVAGSLRAHHLVAEAEVYAGQPTPTILECAQSVSADLVIVGAKGLNAANEFGLGSTAESIVHQADYSVLVARPAEHIRPLNTILAIDGSPQAWRVVKFLCKLSLSNWARVTVVNVVEEEAGELADSEACASEVVDYLHECGFQGRIRLPRGRPADEILSAAREQKASLIVVGAHSQAHSKPSRLGSVAQRVVEDAPCSVLVVR